MSSKTFTKLFSVSNISMMTCFFFSSWVADTAGGCVRVEGRGGGEGKVRVLVQDMSAAINCSEEIAETQK